MIIYLFSPEGERKYLIEDERIQFLEFARQADLRHSFAIHCLEKNIPLNMVSKWMEHSSLEVTTIYANALGKEERKIAARIW